MSRPKHYWHSLVKKMIMQFPNLAEEKTIQSGIFTAAISKSLDDTARMKDGELRVRAVDEILIRHTKTVSGMAIELNYSERTVQGWISNFVNIVGRNAGF